MNITPEEIELYILKNYEDVIPLDSWGERSFFINPDRKLKRGTYFSTLKSKDGDNDKASHLNREGVFRLNIGITPKLFNVHVGETSKRPLKGGVIEGDYDFTERDVFLPHPIYGWLNWISILNPSLKSFSLCKLYLDDAYGKAKKITQKKISKLRMELAVKNKEMV